MLASAGMAVLAAAGAILAAAGAFLTALILGDRLGTTGMAGAAITRSDGTLVGLLFADDVAVLEQEGGGIARYADCERWSMPVVEVICPQGALPAAAGAAA